MADIKVMSTPVLDLGGARNICVDDIENLQKKILYILFINKNDDSDYESVSIRSFVGQLTCKLTTTSFQVNDKILRTGSSWRDF